MYSCDPCLTLTCMSNLDLHVYLWPACPIWPAGLNLSQKCNPDSQNMTTLTHTRDETDQWLTLYLTQISMKERKGCQTGIISDTTHPMSGNSMRETSKPKILCLFHVLNNSWSKLNIADNKTNSLNNNEKDRKTRESDFFFNLQYFYTSWALLIYLKQKCADLKTWNSLVKSLQAKGGNASNQAITHHYLSSI